MKTKMVCHACGWKTCRATQERPCNRCGGRMARTSDILAARRREKAKRELQQQGNGPQR